MALLTTRRLTFHHTQPFIHHLLHSLTYPSPSLQTHPLSIHQLDLLSEPDNQSLGDEQSITRPDGSTVVSRIVMYDLHSVTSNTAAVQLVETEEIKISAKSGAKKGKGRAGSPSKHHGAKDKSTLGHNKAVMAAQSGETSDVILSQQQQQQQLAQEQEEQEQERIKEQAKKDMQVRMDRVTMSGMIEREDDDNHEPSSQHLSNNSNLPPPPPDGGAPTGLRPPLITPLGPPVVKVQGLDYPYCILSLLNLIDDPDKCPI